MNSEDIKEFFKQISEEIDDSFEKVEFLFAVNGEGVFQFNVFNRTDAVFFADTALILAIKNEDQH